MKSKHYLHGGDLDAAAEIYGLNRNEIWDFSGNINPLGTSPKAKKCLLENIEAISTYPDRNYTSLRHTLATYCHTTASHIIVGNGTSELISLIIHLLRPKKALTFAPTYSEYEREIQMVGGTLEYHILEAKNAFALDPDKLFPQLTDAVDMLILCNPNNPTSTMLTPEHLTSILTYCDSRNIFVMVDETYIEFCDNPTLLSAIPLTDKFTNLIVLRGVSKFFSAPGLRFGYGICSDQKLLDELKKIQNPWSVNILAALGVEAMFTDVDYITSTHSLFVAERNRIFKELSNWKHLKAFKPEANFILLKLQDTSLTGSELVSALIKKNMLIRNASSFPSLDESYFRFCFLTRHQNDFLLQELYSMIEIK